MPCYEVRTVSVEFKVAHVDLLRKAVKDLGWRMEERGNDITVWSTGGYGVMTLDRRTDRMTMQPDQQGQCNTLKRAYSQQAIKLAAKLSNGWQNKNLTSTKGQLLRGVM